MASNSKLLTATAAMQLVEAGQVGLGRAGAGQPGSRLGVAPTDGGIPGITLRHLLSHTSGFPQYEATFFGGAADTCEEAAARGLSNGLLAPPGTAYRYSNMNYCVLGLVIEELTGRPYESVILERVLRPLGIDDMRLAGTYDVRPGDVAHPTTPGRTFMEALAGAGAWIGTPTDLVAIIDGLDRSRPGWHPLSAATVDQMQAPQPGIGYSSGHWYGLGLRVWADGTWGHTGTVENARSMVIRRPDGITWAVTVSGNTPSNTDRLRGVVDRAFATMGIPAPPETAPPPPAPASAPPSPSRARAAGGWQTRPVDPLVALAMGSRSDWAVVEHAATTLDELDVPYDVRVVSAHRTPHRLGELTAWAEEAGVEVIVAAAGGAAHLPGMLAAHTVLPVLGIPVPSQHLQGMDSLLSIVQMPAGVPVGTLAIGRAGAINAALLATAIVSAGRPELRARLKAWRAAQTEQVLSAPDPRQP